MNTTTSDTLPGRVRDLRRIPLGQLADQADDARTQRQDIAFNSSI